MGYPLVLLSMVQPLLNWSCLISMELLELLKVLVVVVLSFLCLPTLPQPKTAGVPCFLPCPLTVCFIFTIFFQILQILKTVKLVCVQYITVTYLKISMVAWCVSKYPGAIAMLCLTASPNKYTKI